MDILQNAQQAFRERDFERAEDLLSQALEQDPNNAVILLRLGQVHMAQGNFEESLHFLRSSQKNDPNNPDVYRSFGMAIRMSGMIDLGISYLGIMLTYSPLTLQPQIHLTLAELFAAKGDRISLRSSLLILEQFPSENPRMELRLWQELCDVEGMRRLASRDDSIHDLAMGIVFVDSNPQEAFSFLSAPSCSEMWEADLALYQITKEEHYLQKAYTKASKTAEVLVEVAHLQQEQGLVLLQQLTNSPIVFASVRTKAQRYLS